MRAADWPRNGESYEVYLPCSISKKRGRYLLWVFSGSYFLRSDRETLEDTIQNANDAAYDWIDLELSEDDGVLPSVSDVEDLALEPGDIVRSISVNMRFFDGWDE